MKPSSENQVRVALPTLLLAIALAAGPTVAQVAWRQVASPEPTPAIGASGIAYDPVRDLVVAFGGWDDLSDTWEWDGTRWKLASQAGPSPRLHPELAFDSARGKVVLFGGCECDDDLGTERYPADLWEWDGRSWTQVATGGPQPSSFGPRRFDRMVYQPASGKLLLLAGSTGETWEWDGADWTLVAENGPEGPRWDFVMVHDSRRDRTMVHGGVVNFGDGTDPRTWEWDGERWSVVATDGPPVRRSHAAAYDTRRGVIVLQGGQAGPTDFFLDTWEWDGVRWRQLLADGAPPRVVHRMVYDSARGQMLVPSGGFNFSDVEIDAATTWVLESPIPGSSGDFDGDGGADPAVYDPGSRRWKILGGESRRFGAKNGIPAPGDYDGDGDTDLAFFDAAKGLWRVRGQFRLEGIGAQGDLPAPADYDGDGRTDVATFRPSEGVWEIVDAAAAIAAAGSSTGVAVTRVRFGQVGDLPVPADYDGDGRAEPAVYRPSTRQFLIQGGETRKLGKPGALPVPADYDGDGKANLAVWLPKKGKWKVRGARGARFGELGQIPAPADFDGDGRADFALYDPDTGTWLVRGQGEMRHGKPGELPVVR